mgnify:FL=1
MDPLPPLPESRIPPAWEHSTAGSDAIVRAVAGRPINHVDMLRIVETAQTRLYIGRLQPSVLEMAFAELKSRYHAAEVQISDLQLQVAALTKEVTAYRKMLGSTNKGAM